jgi:hypothetical protein
VLKNRSNDICRAALVTAVASIGITEANGSDVKSPAQNTYYQQCEQLLGKRAIADADADLCMRADLITFGHAGWDFAKEDLEFYGQRTTGSSLFPFLFYGKRDVSEETDSLKGSIAAQANFTFVQPTASNPAVGYVSLQFSTNGDFGSVESIFDEQNIYNDGDIDFYPGVVAEAWVRKGGLSFGIQPSKFDFMRSGFSLFPGYATRKSLASIGYTHRITEDFSVGVAFEDGTQRERDDGVLARYDDDVLRIDPVLLLRGRTGSAVYHLSGALYQADWNGTPFGIPDTTEWGGAVRAGILLHLDRLIGNNSESSWQKGRLLASAAYAQEAMDYLGIPDFAVDYVARQDGTLDLAEGVSGIVSYEYPLAPTIRGIVTGSGFHVEMGGEGHLLSGCTCNTLSELKYDMNVYGAKAQVAMEKVLSTKTSVGAEVSYHWTKATGNYNGFDTDSVTVEYPEVKAYFTRRF